MAKVLIADKLPESTVQMVSNAGYEVENSPGLPPAELKEALKDAVGVICRSGAKLNEEMFSTADRLKAVCRAGVGVDNIDIEAASRQGVVVMNTPGANTISTAEHTFALMLGLSRNVGPAYISMRDGKWDRKKFKGAQLAGKTLGIIGLGRVGRAVAQRARAFDMKLVGLDPYISRDKAKKIGITLHETLEDMLDEFDYLTVHVPVNDETTGMIGADEISQMKPSARIINCARGAIVDRDAAVEAVRAGDLAGAAFDVYTEEPPADHEFTHDDRILATPHLGASTEAAQQAVGAQAAEQLIAALQDGHYRNALNITSVPPEEMDALRPFCELTLKMGKLIGALNSGRLESMSVECKGDIAKYDITPIVNYGVMGMLQTVLGENVNIVSAPHIADERGIEIQGHSSNTTEEGFTDLVTVALSTDQGDIEVSGSVLGQSHPRVMRVAGFDTEIEPEGHLVLLFTPDKPGVVGDVGDTLGDAGINIGQMTFGRQQAGGNSLIALKLDNPCTDDTMKTLEQLDVVEKAVAISL
ncbi:MAG: phosphoglycerate dehydrogenase [Planctomycetota bacterium]